MLKPKFGYKYLGPYNDLENQLRYDKKMETYILIMIDLKMHYAKLLPDMIHVIV